MCALVGIGYISTSLTHDSHLFITSCATLFITCTSHVETSNLICDSLATRRLFTIDLSPYVLQLVPTCAWDLIHLCFTHLFSLRSGVEKGALRQADYMNTNFGQTLAHLLKLKQKIWIGYYERVTHTRFHLHVKCRSILFRN